MDSKARAATVALVFGANRLCGGSGHRVSSWVFSGAWKASPASRRCLGNDWNHPHDHWRLGRLGRGCVVIYARNSLVLVSSAVTATAVLIWVAMKPARLLNDDSFLKTIKKYRVFGDAQT
jgi:hypothetical protein